MSLTEYLSNISWIISCCAAILALTSPMSTSAGDSCISITPGILIFTASVSANRSPVMSSFSPVLTEVTSREFPPSIFTAALRFIPHSLFSRDVTVRCADLTRDISSSVGQGTPEYSPRSLSVSSCSFFASAYLSSVSRPFFSASSERARSRPEVISGHTVSISRSFFSSLSRRSIFLRRSFWSASIPA